MGSKSTTRADKHKNRVKIWRGRAKGSTPGLPCSRELRYLAETSMELRHLAEEREGKREKKSPLPTTDVQDLVHELEVHQEELKIQNKELQSALAKMEALRDRYVELYDFAPVAYFNLDKMGIITEANLTGSRLLGLEQERPDRPPLFPVYPFGFRGCILSLCEEYNSVREKRESVSCRSKRKTEDLSPPSWRASLSTRKV